MTYNKADEDEDGWDCYIQLPVSNDPDVLLPFDKLPPQTNCFVQVKSTDQADAQIDVSLSNWKKLIEHNEPTFFLILSFSGQDTCQAAYLVHIDDNYMRTILKRLREASVANKTKRPLHKRTSKVKYNSAQLLETANGTGLRSAIENHVGNDLSTYIKNKMESRENLGYEDGNQRFNINFQLPDAYKSKGVDEFLIDLSLGIVPGMEFTSGTVTDVRFGIEHSEPLRTLANGRIEMASKSEGTSRLRFTNVDELSEIVLQMETYLPKGFPPELLQTMSGLKVRYSLPFIELIMPYPDGQSNFTLKTPPAQELLLIDDLKRLADCLLFFARSSNSRHRIKMRGNVVNTPTFETPPFVPQFSLSSTTLYVALAIQHFWNICNTFGIQNEVRVTLDYLLSQKDALAYIHQLATHTETRCSAQITFFNANELAGKKILAPHIFKFKAAEYDLRFAVPIVGKAQTTGEIEDG